MEQRQFIEFKTEGGATIYVNPEYIMRIWDDRGLAGLTYIDGSYNTVQMRPDEARQKLIAY